VIECQLFGFLRHQVLPRRLGSSTLSLETIEPLQLRGARPAGAFVGDEIKFDKIVDRGIGLVRPNANVKKDIASAAVRFQKTETALCIVGLHYSTPLRSSLMIARRRPVAGSSDPVRVSSQEFAAIHWRLL
jgi:hypothetical protein